MTESELGAMGLTRIEAPSYREAMRQITERFGNDVAIVHTRTLRAKGVLGLLGVTGVEVFVTSSQQYQAWRDRNWRTPEGRPDVAARPRVRETGAGDGAIGPGSSARPVLDPEPSSNASTPSAGNGDVLESLKSLQEQMRALLQARQDAASPAGVLHPVLQEARQLLKREEFSTEAQESLLDALAHRQLPGTSRDGNEIGLLARLAIRDLLRPKVPPCHPIVIDAESLSDRKPRLVALVGPTGVGKTTTIAKLASSLHLRRQCKVGLISLDTYRIGATEQLGRYAAITGLPFAVVGAGESVAVALETLSGCQVIFVDTAGRSQNDAVRLGELRTMLSGFGDLQTHLCTSATASVANLLDVVDGFRSVSYDRLLITKIDEVSRGGALFEALQRARVPVSYLTCGQEVPDDIRPASEDGLLDLLVRG